MTNIPYISIKSVLYEMASLVPKRYWDETRFLEWAVQGLRRLEFTDKYVNSVAVLPIIDHIVSLPENIKYLVQVAYRPEKYQWSEDHLRQVLGLEKADWNQAVIKYLDSDGFIGRIAGQIPTANQWKPMRATNNTFFQSLVCTPNMFPNLEFNLNCDNCNHEYQIRHNNTLLTSIKEGIVMLSYLHFPEDEEGDTLIPDVEEVKEAIMHYCLWKYWLGKSLIGEDKSQNERDYHKIMFGVMKAKAAAVVNQPSLDMLENIKNEQGRLVPRRNRFSGLFNQLGSNEKTSY